MSTTKEGYNNFHVEYHQVLKGKRVWFPTRFVFVDTETTRKQVSNESLKHYLRLGQACYAVWNDRTRKDTEEWFGFTDADSLWDWLLSRTVGSVPLHVIGHNLKFDFLVLDGLRQLVKRGWLVYSLYEKGLVFLLRAGLPTDELLSHLDAGGEITEFTGKKFRKRIQFVDNTNLFPGKLASLGDSLNLKKLTMPETKDADENWDVYCKRDVEIMVEAWRKRIALIKQEDLGSFKLTLASQAMSTYRYKFMTDRIFITRFDWQMKMEREAYRGGRTEAFFVGNVEETPLYKLDVNSMYPYVMEKFSYPTALRRRVLNPTLKEVQKLLWDYLMIATVSLDVDEPVFPQRMNKRNVYPTGRFNTVLTTKELEYALAMKWVLDVEEVLLYSHAKIFEDYVNYFYLKRLQATKKGDGVARLMYKMMLNTAYGKWGQLGYKDRIIGTCDKEDFRVEHGHIVDTGVSFTHTYLGGVVTESVQEGDAYNAFPAIAAHVTANARMYLWWLFEEAGRENVYYCDTDSLFVNKKGYENLKPLLDDTALGALKVEGVSDNVVLNAPKDYVWSGKPTLKGIPEQAIKVRSYEYLMEIWPSLRGHISRKQVDGFYNVPMRKLLKRKVMWGEKGEDGWVVPYSLGG